MRRYFLIAIIVLIGLGLGGYFFFSRTKDSEGFTSEDETAYVPRVGEVVPLDPAVIPQDEKILFGTAMGAVEVNNFYKSARGFDGDALVVSSASNYRIFYNAENSAFGVLLIGSDLGRARTEAEKEFLDKLGILQKEACKLDVMVYSADPAFGGTAKRLSFCL